MNKPVSTDPGVKIPSPAAWGAIQRNYVLFILCVVGVLNFIDRQVITIVLQPIKEEFHASDTAMGLITGLLFAGVYCVTSVPLARFSDRYPRKIVLASCLAAWSLMTSLGGLAHSFLQLGATRLGVAAAEGGSRPASHSILADLYPVRFRGTAIAVLTASQSIGIGLGVFLGGWISSAFNWRTTFMIVGLPGILVAALMLLTVREPPRGLSDKKIDTSDTPKLGQAFKILFATPSYRCLLFAVGLGAFSGWGLLSWGPTFLLRVHHLSPATVGVWFGGVVATSLVIGNLTGGIMSDLLGKRDLRAYLWVSGIGSLLSIPGALLFVTATDWRWALVGMFFCTLLLTVHVAPCYAMGQTIAPIRVRATAAVLLTLSATLVGTGLAPVIIGGLNDVLAQAYGDQAIRYSLATGALGAAGAAAAAFMGSIWIRGDYVKLHGSPAGDAAPEKSGPAAAPAP